MQEELTESPISPDNTVAEYVFDVTDYIQVEFQLRGIGFASGDFIIVEASVDGGSNYKQGASDYHEGFLNSGIEATTNRASIRASDATATSDHNSRLVVTNLRAGRLGYSSLNEQGNSTNKAEGVANFDGPVTHIKIRSSGGANFNAGTIRAVGLR